MGWVACFTMLRSWGRARMCAGRRRLARPDDRSGDGGSPEEGRLGTGCDPGGALAGLGRAAAHGRGKKASDDTPDGGGQATPALGRGTRPASRNLCDLNLPRLTLLCVGIGGCRPAPTPPACAAVPLRIGFHATSWRGLSRVRPRAIWTPAAPVAPPRCWQATRGARSWRRGPHMAVAVRFMITALCAVPRKADSSGSWTPSLQPSARCSARLRGWSWRWPSFSAGQRCGCRAVRCRRRDRIGTGCCGRWRSGAICGSSMCSG